MTGRTSHGSCQTYSPVAGLYERTDGNIFVSLNVVLRATTACLKVLPFAVPLTYLQRPVTRLPGTHLLPRLMGATTDPEDSAPVKAIWTL